MNLTQTLTALKKLGSEQTKKTLLRHGAVEPLFGVKVEDLKKLLKTLKPNHPLALELYASGIADAMYLAALLCEPKEMTAAQLDTWAKTATSPMLSACAVAWPAAESRHAMALAKKWIDAKQPHVAASGWSTLSSYVAITPDADLDARQLQALLNRVVKEIAGAPNRVKLAMNGFVIAVGTHVQPLADAAVLAAKKLGKVEADVGDTACKVPVAADYIAKAHKAGKLGAKRKTAFC